MFSIFSNYLSWPNAMTIRSNPLILDTNFNNDKAWSMIDDDRSTVIARKRLAMAKPPHWLDAEPTTTLHNQERQLSNGTENWRHTASTLSSAPPCLILMALAKIVWNACSRISSRPLTTHVISAVMVWGWRSWSHDARYIASWQNSGRHLQGHPRL